MLEPVAPSKRRPPHSSLQPPFIPSFCSLLFYFLRSFLSARNPSSPPSSLFPSLPRSAVLHADQAPPTGFCVEHASDSSAAQARSDRRARWPLSKVRLRHSRLCFLLFAAVSPPFMLFTPMTPFPGELTGLFRRHCPFPWARGILCHLRKSGVAGLAGPAALMKALPTKLLLSPSVCSFC